MKPGDPPPKDVYPPTNLVSELIVFSLEKWQGNSRKMENGREMARKWQELGGFLMTMKGSYREWLYSI